MHRLHHELQRLYGLPPHPTEPARGAPCRAYVLQLSRPADWQVLSAVWKGVQVDLGLPAPAIAVDGRAGIELWFSMAQPVDEAQGLAFLAALQRRYLGDVAPGRVDRRAVSSPGSGSGDDGAESASGWPVPAQRGEAEAWSAYVAPDLAAVFGDTPWLEMAPSEDGQADLLARLRSIGADDYGRALAALADTVRDTGDAATGTHAGSPSSPPSQPTLRMPAPVDAPAGCMDENPPSVTTDPAASAESSHRAARQFLLRVMNDDGASLAVRVQAAQALLQAGSRASPLGDR